MSTIPLPFPDDDPPDRAVVGGPPRGPVDPQLAGGSSGPRRSLSVVSGAEGKAVAVATGSYVYEPGDDEFDEDEHETDGGIIGWLAVVFAWLTLWRR